MRVPRSRRSHQRIDKFVNTPDDLDAALIPASIDAIARLHKETNARVVLVTNQGGVGLGKMSDETAHAIMERLAERVDQAGGHFDAIYYCPTAPNAPAPTTGIDARKPSTGMIRQAAADLPEVDLADSYMIGDMTTDIATGENTTTKITSILVRTGFGGGDGKEHVAPDHISADLAEAVDWIVAREKTLSAS